MCDLSLNRGSLEGVAGLRPTSGSPTVSAKSHLTAGNLRSFWTARSHLSLCVFFYFALSVLLSFMESLLSTSQLTFVKVHSSCFRFSHQPRILPPKLSARNLLWILSLFTVIHCSSVVYSCFVPAGFPRHSRTTWISHSICCTSSGNSHATKIHGLTSPPTSHCRHLLFAPQLQKMKSIEITSLV